MSMNECDKINSYNALVSANHKESFIAPEKPKTVANSVDEHIQKNIAEKEAEKAIVSGYSSSPAINTKFITTETNKSTKSSTYSGGSSASYYNSGYYNSSSSGSSQNLQYRGNNLDYNSRISKIRQKAKETAERERKYEQSRGAGLIDFEGKYSFSIEKGKVKHHTNNRRNKVSKLFNKGMAKQVVVAASVIVLEAALGMAMTEAKSSITGISNEIKKSFTNKSK